MAIKLREKEELKVEVTIHWSALILPKMLAGLGGIFFLGSIIGSVTGASSMPVSTGLTWAIFLCIPFVYKWIEYKAKKYIVTNQRIYIEEGVISKTKSDLPLNKINDVSMKQSLSQRMFGAGDLLLLTGNDKPTIMKNIDRPEEFKNTISEMIEKRAS
jgi:uncharacterized membrane protein YdbT with pleckstrin-like domain